eukprot:801846-Amphidinium_carterae.1
MSGRIRRSAEPRAHTHTHTHTHTVGEGRHLCVNYQNNNTMCAGQPGWLAGGFLLPPISSNEHIHHQCGCRLSSQGTGRCVAWGAARIDTKTSKAWGHC